METRSDTPRDTRPSTYGGLFLLALASVMLEVLLTRITSVIAWYHLAFFVISLAMLGLTAGAVIVFVQPRAFGDAQIPARLTQAALGFALATPLCVALALAMPLTPVTDFMSFVALFMTGGLLALPFAFAGVALTLALTRAGLPPNLAYGVDLFGAALGCALVIPALALLDAPSAALLAAALGALSAATFAHAAQRTKWPSYAVASALLGLTIANASAPVAPLRPAWVKGEREQPEDFLYTRWNSHSRVTVEPLEGSPVLWAAGNNTPIELLAPIEQRVIKIDGAAGTVMARMGDGPAAHAYLGWDLTALVHELRPSGSAAVIGVGGGHDVLAALRAQHDRIVGIELNRAIVDLHEREMEDFSGILSLPGVTLVHDEARSYLARDRRRYSVIAMSLIDTWASTGTGAYSLSENGLYTVEAWQTFLRRLSRGGILAVSRWYFEKNPGETARMLALALDALWASGVRAPHAHVALLQNRLVATLLLSRRPYSPDDLALLRRAANDKGYNVLVLPGETTTAPLLREIVQQPSRAALAAWTREQPLDLSPPSDARPFFFNMLRPSSWLLSRAEIDELDLPFLGNLQATQSLLYAVLVSLLLALATIVWPLRSRLRDLSVLPTRDVAAALAYFALIGLGFMFVEIGLLSRLSVFLGHPTLALVVLLGGLIVFTGVGSLLSGRVPLAHRLGCLYPLAPAALVVAAALTIGPLLRAFEASSTPLRVVVSLGLILPPALAMGLCFPLGLRAVESLELLHAAAERPKLGPWLWAINGAFGVVASGLSLATSIVWGISATLLIGAACYLLLALLTVRLARAAAAS
jgi:spermidine synthase